MKERSRILVTGATGNVGGQVVFQLASTGAAVRALVHNPDATDMPDEVEVVRGDPSWPDTLADALTGVEAVLLVWPFLDTEAAPEVREEVYCAATTRGSEKTQD